VSDTDVADVPPDVAPIWLNHAAALSQCLSRDRHRLA